MKDLPIIFSAPMVRALLDGRKTQTRRILKPQPAQWQAMVIDITHPFFNEEEGGWGQVETIWSGPLVPGMCEPEREEWRPLRLRYAVGDRLWVKENFRGAQGYENMKLSPAKWGNKPIWYCADGEPDSKWWHLSKRVRPSIHMPRWASRITLEVTEVRVQRLQEITREDAMAEGIVQTWGDFRGNPPQWAIDSISDHGDASGSHIYDNRTSIQNYAVLWNSLHGPDAWEANPWVAAISFKREKSNG